MKLSDFVKGLCNFINNEVGCDNCPYAVECNANLTEEIEENDFEMESLEG